MQSRLIFDRLRCVNQNGADSAPPPPPPPKKKKSDWQNENQTHDPTTHKHVCFFPTPATPVGRNIRDEIWPWPWDKPPYGYDQKPYISRRPEFMTHVWQESATTPEPKPATHHHVQHTPFILFPTRNPPPSGTPGGFRFLGGNRVHFFFGGGGLCWR